MPPQLQMITLEPLSKFLNGQSQQRSIRIFHRRKQEVDSTDMCIEKLSRIFFPEGEYFEIEGKHDFPLERFSYRGGDSPREWAEYCWIDIVSPIHNGALVLLLLHILVRLLYLFKCVQVYRGKIGQEASREIFVFSFGLDINQHVYWLLSLGALDAIGAFKVARVLYPFG